MQIESLFEQQEQTMDNAHTKSIMVNCQLIHRTDQQGAMFSFPVGQPATFNLDGYLICPVDMFARDEVIAARTRYENTNAD